MTKFILANAKPYAKAIFRLALEHNQLLVWQDILKILAAVAIECEKNKLLDNPKITATQKVDFFSASISQAPEAMNLVKLLVERKKLSLLPDILAGYQQLFLAYNNILEVKIISACELSVAQKEQLLCVLKERYQSEISLQCYTDAALVGGAVMYIADKVIDVSIKGTLQRLKQNLLLKSAYAASDSTKHEFQLSKGIC